RRPSRRGHVRAADRSGRRRDRRDPVRAAGERVKLRTARAAEAEWINARYAEVRFMPSDLAHEVVVIAETGDEPAGLGRLVDIDERSCELGGMLVFERFRG